MRRIFVGWMFALSIFPSTGDAAAPNAGGPVDRGDVVRIGYFQGGRTGAFYRAYLNGLYEKEKVQVRLISKSLNSDKTYDVPQSTATFSKPMLKSFGKISGVRLIDDILAGKMDAALVGESSFLSAANEGKEIVAIALLGHDEKEHPGHAIVFRKGLEIRSPKDIKGLTLASRRAGPGDEVFLREFLVQEGLEPDKEVKIIPNTPDDLMEKWLKRGEIDGGFFHLFSLRRVVRHHRGYVYRPLNWVNAEMSQALLVFSKSFVQKHPDLVLRLVRAYMAEISHEKALPLAERRKLEIRGLQIEEDFQGMSLPQFDLPPLVRQDLLDDMQRLLVKHGRLPRAVRLDPYIDNSFVRQAAKDLGIR